MKSRRFFLGLALAGAVLVAFNIFLAARVDSVPRLILRKIAATPQIDVLFLGNSLMQSGIDPATFQAAWPGPSSPPPVFNAGLGGSTPVEQYLLLRQIYRQHAPMPVLVYGFFDLQLTEQQPGGWDDLKGNRAMSYDFEPRTAAALYYPGSAYESWRFALIGAIPMLRDHSQLWKYVELFRRRLEGLGLPPPKADQFGRIGDFEPIVLPDKTAFDRACRDFAQDSAPLAPAVQAIFQLAQENKTRVIVVEMPLAPARRNLYYASHDWRQYRDRLRQLLQAQGISYVVASDWIGADGFEDGLHLNDAGARIFSTRMAQTLAAPAAP